MEVQKNCGNCVHCFNFEEETVFVDMRGCTLHQDIIINPIDNSCEHWDDEVKN